MPVANSVLSTMVLGLRSPFSAMAYTLLPWRSDRASSTPEAQVSTLKPGGSLNLAVGNWSTAVGMGNDGTGAMRVAASVLGRPLAQPGSSAGGCWAHAAVVATQSRAA